MAGMRDLMSGYADSASDTIGRWANGLRSAPTGEAPQAPGALPEAAPAAPTAAASPGASAMPGGDAIPGMQATERPFNGSADARTFATDPGPGNPNVGRPAPTGNYPPAGGGAAAANEAGVAADAANAGKFFGGGSQGVGSAIKNVAGGLVEPVKGLAKGNVLLGGAMGVAEGAGTDTSDYERRFGLAPNTDSGLAGFARDVGVRGLGVASDVGNRIAFGLPKQFLYRDGPNGDAPTPPASAAARPASASNAPTYRADVQTGGSAGQSSAPDANGVRQVSPNSFTNVTGDTKFDARGTPSAQNEAAAQALSDRYSREAQYTAGPAAAPASVPSGTGLSIMGDSGQAAIDARNASIGNSIGDLMRGGVMSGRQAGAYLNQQRSNALTARGQDISRLNSLGNNATSLRTTGMNNDTSRANNLESTGAAIYGHQLTRAGTLAQLQYERMKSDRQYGLDTAKFGEEQAQHNFTQRQQSVKDAHTEIGNMLAPVNDGTGKMVPDAATASRYATGLTTLVGERQAQLTQRAQAGDKGAASQLEQLSTKGLGALSTADKQRFIAGMKATDLANQYHSGALNPIGGTGVMTNAPVKSMKRVSSLTGDYYQTDTGAKIPARAVEKENADFMGGKHRVDLNVLTQ